jgi:hypothetical protein
VLGYRNRYILDFAIDYRIPGQADPDNPESRKAGRLGRGLLDQDN